MGNDDKDEDYTVKKKEKEERIDERQLLTSLQG